MFRAYGSSSVDASIPWGLNFNNGPKGNLKIQHIYVIIILNDNIDNIQRHFTIKCQHLWRLQIYSIITCQQEVLYAKAECVLFTAFSFIFKNLCDYEISTYVTIFVGNNYCSEINR